MPWMRARARLRPFVAAAFLAILVALVISNLDHDIRYQDALGPIAARTDTMTTAIQNPFSMLYRLRVLAGKTMVVPQARSLLGSHIALFSDIHVEMVDDPMSLPKDVTDRLRAIRTFEWPFFESTYADVLIDPAATRYVMAGLDDDPRRCLILPESVYRAEVQP